LNNTAEKAVNETGKNPMAIAQTILDGFDKHYSRFREFSNEAKSCFENADWARVGEAGKERIQGYETRVSETVDS
jgi:isocitrate dehydrogenase kinase/phosphatase